VTTTYTCPMHPEIVRDAPGKCPICGMKLVPSALVAESGHSSMTHAADDSMAAHVHHGQHEAVPPRQQHQSADPHAHHGTHTAHHAGAENDQQHGGHQQDAHGTPATDGIEWEDDMVAINRATTPANMRWKLVDRVTGYEGHAIDWHFRVGERVKIRLINEMDSDHPMHHPFHIHGAGRFLVLGRDGLTESNLMWKDTVLVRKGETVDILLDVTNPGVWMAHCHIAEHHESGMMMSFHVSE